MKEVKVRIVGDLVIVDYCSQKVIDENIESGECDDEQKQELYKKCIKSVYIEHDGITSHGRIIEINMIDGVKHTIHMTKRGNYFNTFIVTNKGEKEFDFDIEKRFERKIIKRSVKDC